MGEKSAHRRGKIDPKFLLLLPYPPGQLDKVLSQHSLPGSREIFFLVDISREKCTLVRWTRSFVKKTRILKQIWRTIPARTKKCQGTFYKVSTFIRFQDKTHQIDRSPDEHINGPQHNKTIFWTNWRLCNNLLFLLSRIRGRNKNSQWRKSVLTVDTE